MRTTRSAHLLLALAVATTGACATNSEAATTDDEAFCEASLETSEAAIVHDFPSILEGMGQLAATSPSEEFADWTTQALELMSTDPGAAFESEAMGNVITQHDELIAEHCASRRLDVVAVDYAFEGDDGQAIDAAPLPAGRTLLSLKGDSASDTWHQAVVARIDDGVSSPAIDLLTLDGERIDTTAVETFEGDGSLTFIGGVDVGPDGSDLTLLRLTPGRYVMFCAIPMDLEQDHESPTHLDAGMFLEFEVA